MIFTRNILVFFIFLEATNASLNCTRTIPRSSVLLSRKRRYLSFPMNSNFVMTLSEVKAFLQTQPRGWNFLLECDVPFGLPSDTSFFKKKDKRSLLEKRDVYSKLQDTLLGNNINGSACLRRVICEVRSLVTTSGRSMVKDLLQTIFTIEESEDTYEDACDPENFERCGLPLLDIFLNMSPLQYTN